MKLNSRNMLGATPIALWSKRVRMLAMTYGLSVVFSMYSHFLHNELLNYKFALMYQNSSKIDHK